jgi:hypothetical protein
MDNLLAEAGRFSLPSTYFMLAGTRRMVRERGRRVMRYDIQRPALRDLMERVHSAGSELGLHISYEGYAEARRMSSELSILRRNAPPAATIAGARSHYLRFTIEKTWSQEAAAGLYYDSSLGWSEGWGFRSGSAVPFEPFDVANGQPLGLWELELHLMDVAVSASEFTSCARRLVQEVRQTGGCCGILLHPTPWDNRSVGEHLTIHRETLEFLSRQPDVWVSTPSEIVAAMDKYKCDVTNESLSE